MATVVAPPEPKVPSSPPAQSTPLPDAAKLVDELAKIPLEPFLPIEAKLVTWSLILGIGLLGLLVWISYTFFPG
jgi:hypothetical protein